MSNNFTSTTIPLLNNGVYLGRYIDVSQYTSAIISVFTDQPCQITAYQSINKQRTIPFVFDYLIADVNSLKTFSLNPLQMPFIYFTVLNNSGNDQTYLNFSVKFDNNSLSNGTAGSLNEVQIINPFLEVKSYSTLSTQDSQLYNLLNSRGSSILHNGSILAGGNTASVNLSTKKISNLTIYGNQNSNGNELTVLFSNDNSTFYKSQYTFSFGTLVNGDFGFNLQGCVPKYMALQSKNACILTAYVDYS